MNESKINNSSFCSLYKLSESKINSPEKRLQQNVIKQANLNCEKKNLWNNFESFLKCAKAYQDENGFYHPTYGSGNCYKCATILDNYQKN